MLNDIAAFTAHFDLGREDRSLVAAKWLNQTYEPILAMIPPEARGKLEPAEIFHEILVHRWYLSERAGHAVDLLETARDYMDTVLMQKPDEEVAADESSREQLLEGDRGDALLLDRQRADGLADLGRARRTSSDAPQAVERRGTLDHRSRRLRLRERCPDSAGRRRGSRTTKVVPVPGVDSHLQGAAVHLDHGAGDRQPETGAGDLLLSSRVDDRKNRVNSSSCSSAGMPIPVSVTSSTASSAVAVRRDADAATGRRELDGVVDQVDHHALQHLARRPRNGHRERRAGRGSRRVPGCASRWRRRRTRSAGRRGDPWPRRRASRVSSWIRESVSSLSIRVSSRLLLEPTRARAPSCCVVDLAVRAVLEELRRSRRCW